MLLSYLDRGTGIERQRYNEPSAIGGCSASSGVSGPANPRLGWSEVGKGKSGKSRGWKDCDQGGGRRGVPLHSRQVTGTQPVNDTQLPSPFSSFESSPILDKLAFGMGIVEGGGVNRVRWVALRHCRRR